VKTIDLTHLKTTYQIEGTGPDVLWISGGGGRADDWHEHYTSEFGDSYRSVSFDNRGTMGSADGCRVLPLSRDATRATGPR
jgi:pimeloyl-ACP methyl ester carboxylesterase